MNTSKINAASISATQELSALVEITKTNRQFAWHSRLITCLPHAIFTGGKPEIIFNPAGFTYYNLEIADSNPESESKITYYNIPELIDTFLIHEGVGIAIEAHDPKQVIDLSYGDILGFYLNRTFSEPEEHLFQTDKPRAHIISKDMEIYIENVPTEILPTASIKLLESIMLHLGINKPNIKLAYLIETKQYEIVFLVESNDMEPNKAQTIIQKLGWFLPRYYSYLICDLNNLSGTNWH